MAMFNWAPFIPGQVREEDGDREGDCTLRRNVQGAAHPGSGNFFFYNKNLIFYYNINDATDVQGLYFLIKE